VEDKDNATLASKGQPGQQRQKKDISKVKCFKCGEMGHYASQSPLKKKDNDEKHDPKVVAAKIDEEEFAMTVEIPPGGRWVDIELQSRGLQMGRILQEPTSWIITSLREPMIRSSRMVEFQLVPWSVDSTDALARRARD